MGGVITEADASCATFRLVPSGCSSDRPAWKHTHNLDKRDTAFAL